MQIDVMKIEVSMNEENGNFLVNGIELDKNHIMALFPEKKEPDHALASYLASMPFLAYRADHFLKFHIIGESAKYALHKAKELYTAIGINDENMIPFMHVFFDRAETDPGELTVALKNAFGECHAEEDEARRTVH